VIACLVAIAHAASLYAVVTELGGNETETVQYVVSIDPTSGQLKSVTPTLVITGSSLMYDGISTFDDINGNFFYCPDWPSPLIYSVDVEANAIRPPIYIPAQNEVGLERLEYDPALQNVLALVTVQTGRLDKAYLVSIPVESKGGFKVYGTFSTSFYIYSTDAYNNNFYIVGKNVTTSQWQILTINLTSSSSNPISSVNINGSGCPTTAYPIKFVYDAVLNKFFAYAESQSGNQLSYAVWTIAANGACTSSAPLNIPSGITTSYTYDAADHILWVGHTTNGGSYAVSYSVQNSTVLKQLPISYVPEALEFAYKH